MYYVCLRLYVCLHLYLRVYIDMYDIFACLVAGTHVFIHLLNGDTS